MVQTTVLFELEAKRVQTPFRFQCGFLCSIFFYIIKEVKQQGKYIPLKGCLKAISL